MKVSLTTLLTVLFVGLKLTGYIDWSWIWVLSPLWITAILYVAILVFFLIIALLTGNKIVVRKKK